MIGSLKMMTEIAEKPEGGPEDSSAEDGPRWGKMALPMLSGTVCGGIAAVITVQLIKADVFGALGFSESAAILVGLIYVMIALGIGVGVVSPVFGLRFLNAEDAEELREQRQGLISSAGGMLALGLVLAVLAISGPQSRLSAETGGFIAAGLLFAGVILTLRSAKHADELMRALSNETGNASYYLISSVVGGWAALAHLEIVPPPAMLDILSMMWVLGLLAAFIVIGKRGMLSPR